MVVGALLLVLGQGILARTKVAPRAPVIESFSSLAEHDDVTSPRGGSIGGDGEPDDQFELVVTGPVVGIVVAQHHPTGRPMPNAVRWGTNDYDPAAAERAGYGMPAVERWQLAVTENSDRLNEPLGGMRPLDAGRHRLVLHLSSNGAFASGALLRAYVIGPDETVTTSDAVRIAGSWSAPKPPPIPPPPPPTNGRAFDRGAAAAALGAVKVDHCAKLAGAKLTGRAEVEFAPDGRVSSVRVIEGLEPTTPAALCVAAAMSKNVRIPKFDGAPVHVKKSFTLEGAAPTHD